MQLKLIKSHSSFSLDQCLRHGPGGDERRAARRGGKRQGHGGVRAHLRQNVRVARRITRDARDERCATRPREPRVQLGPANLNNTIQAGEGANDSRAQTAGWPSVM